MLTAIKARAPVTGGNFGVWGGMFSTFDCAVKGFRKKEDPYNSIIAGFLTGGSLAIRGGYKAARNGAIMCAIFLAVIEGVGIGIQRLMAENTRLDVSLDFCLVSDCRRLLTMHSYLLLKPPQRPVGWQVDWKRPPFHISFKESFWLAGLSACRLRVLHVNFILYSPPTRFQLHASTLKDFYISIAGVWSRTEWQARKHGAASLTAICAKGLFKGWKLIATMILVASGFC